MIPDNSVQNIQSVPHVEQSSSIDPNVARKKKQRQLVDKKKRQQRMERDIDKQVEDNNDSGHIDYRA